MSLSANERSRIIEEALRIKFKTFYRWKRPQLAHEYGANNLEYVEIFEKKLASLLESVKIELEAMSDDELSDFRGNSDKSWTDQDRRRISRLQASEPPPITFGYGHPKLAADFSYWRLMPRLSLFEVTALSLGADPRIVTQDYLETKARNLSSKKKLWAADKRLLEQKEVFSRYFRHTGWGYGSEAISSVKAWIDKMQIPVHPDFYSALSKNDSAEIPQSPDELSSKPLLPQERETLLKLIAAMACEQYRYNPDDKRSDVTSNVKDDLERVGLSMDDKTIRKWLKEASDFVDADYWGASR